MIRYYWAKLSYWWFVGMLILVGLFVPTKVYGANVTTSSDQWLTTWCSNTSCDYTVGGSTYSTGYQNRNTAYSNSNHYYLTTIRLRQQFSSSNYLQSGTQYVFQYKMSFNPRYFQHFDLDYWEYKLNVINSNNNATDITSGYSCNTTSITNSNYEFYITCVYIPNSSLKQVLWNIELPFYEYTDASDYSGYVFKSFNSVNYKTISIQYSTGTQDAIDMQTTIITNQTNLINDSITSLINSNNDDSIDNPSDMIEDFEDMLPTNGTITNLIALPITLYTKILNSINGTCQSFNLGSLYGTNIIFPCIEVSTYLGSSLWGTIDLILSGSFVLVISKKMIKAFESFTSMKEGDVIND